MPDLSTDLVIHKLPTDSAFPSVKHKLIKFNTDMSVKIKEEITKQLDAKVNRVTQYPTWLANIVPVPKKDGKTRLLKKDAMVKWTDECQEAFDKIKGYLSNPPVLVPPEPRIPLILYLTVLDNSFDCMLGQHDIKGNKEQTIYYLIKKFTSYEELDGEPWFHDIREYIKSGVYPVQATDDQKRIIRHLASGFFLSGGILYKRTTDLGLLRCIDAKQASTIMAKVHGDLIHSPPSELHTMSAPWPFVAWGMDVIGPIGLEASSGHRFILVAIDYFNKWVEAVTFKYVTKKVVVDFVHSNLICRFGIPKVIITDNVANLNSLLIKEVCQQFKIMHRNSTPYCPMANGVVVAANKNIKKIL
ncbi:uncharacterized protein [Nicotiana sylvestris]|uniref:uncharacterized protein n=1 Tax=Nicotiana sylvestris TaxID=4096 RepID=UPI00388CC92D